LCRCERSAFDGGPAATSDTITSVDVQVVQRRNRTKQERCAGYGGARLEVPRVRRPPRAAATSPGATRLSRRRGRWALSRCRRRARQVLFLDERATQHDADAELGLAACVSHWAAGASGCRETGPRSPRGGKL
jgi:hypothetical protein